MKFSHFVTCRLASSVQIIWDPTADFKVTVSSQFASRIWVLVIKATATEPNANEASHRFAKMTVARIFLRFLDLQRRHDDRMPAIILFCFFCLRTWRVTTH